MRQLRDRVVEHRGLGGRVAARRPTIAEEVWSRRTVAEGLWRTTSAQFGPPGPPMNPSFILHGRSIMEEPIGYYGEDQLTDC